MTIRKAVRAFSLLILLALALLAAPAGAQSPVWTVTGAGMLVNGPDQAREKTPTRSYGIYVAQSADGKLRGALSFADKAARFRLRAETIESFTASAGVATIVGTAKIGADDGYRFRLVLRERQGQGKHHLTLDASGPKLVSYRADADVQTGALRIVQPGARPTATLVSGASDSFDRTAGNPLCYAETGNVWLYPEGSLWEICIGGASGVARPVAAYGSPPENWARVQTSLSSHRVTARTTIRPITAAGDAGIAARVSADWQNMVWVGLSSGGTLTVWTSSAGTWAQRDTATNAAWNSSAERNLIVNILGDRLKVYVDNTASPAIPEINVGNASSDTYAGVFATASGPATDWPRFQSFTVGMGQP